MKEKIEMRVTFEKYDAMQKLSDLKVSKHQRNKHPKEQIERLAKIMHKHGVRHPISVSRLSGEVCFGHGRWAAAKLNGWKTYPVVYQDFKDDTEEYACVQSDNGIALWAEMDISAINEDLLKLGAEFDLDLLGIKDLAIIEPEELEPGCDEDEVPEYVVEPKTKLGDIYTLGRHRLMCGDSTSVDAVVKLMNGDRADMVFTSPPYNIGANSFPDRGVGGSGKKYKNDKDIKEDYPKFLSEILSTWITFADYVWINVQSLSANQKAIVEWLYLFREMLCERAIWSKTNPVPSALNKGVMSHAFEDIYIFSEKPRGRVCGDYDGIKSNVYTSSVNSNNEIASIHSATFSVEFASHWISTSRNSVADPFGGSGTTMIAAEKLGRKCFMMELDPHYCDVIVTRWEKYTGQKAEITNGQT